MTSEIGCPLSPLHLEARYVHGAEKDLYEVKALMDQVYILSFQQEPGTL